MNNFQYAYDTIERRFRPIAGSICIRTAHSIGIGYWRIGIGYSHQGIYPISNIQYPIPKLLVSNGLTWQSGRRNRHQFENHQPLRLVSGQCRLLPVAQMNDGDTENC